MGWRDEVAKGHEQKTVPKFRADIQIELKQHDNKSCWKWYNSETEEEVFADRPIEGILIGTANRKQVYGKDLGSRGLTLTTTPYWASTDPVVVFAKQAGAKAEFKGTAEEAEEYMFNQAKSNVSTRKILFVVSKDACVEINTNMSLTIDLLSQFEKGTWENFFCILTPKLFTGEEEWLGKRAKKALGELAVKNPPTYAFIEKGKEIPDEVGELWDVESYAKAYNEWHEHYKGLRTKDRGEQPEQTQDLAEAPDFASELPPPNVTGPEKKAPKPKSKEKEDDLPF